MEHVSSVLSVCSPQASCGVRDPVRGLRGLRGLLRGQQREQAGAGPGSGSPDGLLHQLDAAVSGLSAALLEVQQTLRSELVIDRY